MIEEVGGFVKISMDELILSSNAHDMETHDIVSTIARFSLQIFVRIFKICAAHDNWNSSVDQLPPVLPLDLCSVNLRDFTSCLQQQVIWFKQKFSDTEVEKIDDQFCKLHLVFKEQIGFSQMLHKHAPLFNHLNSVGAYLERSLKTCKGFVRPLQAFMPGTSSIESDFSLINWTKDSSSQGLTDFSLESLLHCKQYQKLRDLFE